MGTEPDPAHGAIATPIYQTTTYAIPSVEELIARYRHRKPGYTYTSTEQTMGITDSLVRASVGIEDFDDLARDFEQALSSV